MTMPLTYVLRASAILIVLLGGVVDVRADETDDEVAKQWRIVREENKTPVIPGNLYGIKNVVIQQFLKYGRRDHGINLAWAKDTQQNMFLKRKSASMSPIKSGELFAIHVKPYGKYLAYKVRPKGVNLGWSDTPVYEWKIEGKKTDEVIETSTNVGIYNTVEKDKLVYCEQPWGINLDWEKDKDKDGCKSIWDVVRSKVTETATGTLPSGVDDVLVKGLLEN
jgi:hypothetical protein